VAELESPDSAEELYRYRGQDVVRARPIFQDDVFEHVEIPGLDDGPGLAMVMTHPCTMRGKGGLLQPRLLMGRVAPSAIMRLPWKGSFKLFPLPELVPGRTGGHWAVNFEDMGPVRTELLGFDDRIACLDDRGVLLLQQRHTHHLTRYVVETQVLYEQSAPVLVEAELLEEWLGAALHRVDDQGWDAAQRQETTMFDDFFSSMRDHLKDASRRAAVRRNVLQEIERRFQP
jgi:hypothetical protein